jgi:hypothetical protein
MDLIFGARSQVQSAAARFAGCLRQGGNAPHSSICFVHKDAWSRRFVASFLGFFSRARVTTIVSKLQEMEDSKSQTGPRSEGLRRYQIIVWIPAECRSRVMSGRPSWSAAAAIILSGISATRFRGMRFASIVIVASR